MWQPVDVPSFCERLLGFSVPIQNEVLAISYEGVHVLTLGEEITVASDEDHVAYDIYDPETGQARYAERTWDIIGLHPGKPLLTTPRGERLELALSTHTLTVVRGEAREFTTEYENFSGDWAAATFSPDGRYLVLGCPQDFDFRVWRRLGD